MSKCREAGRCSVQMQLRIILDGFCRAIVVLGQLVDSLDTIEAHVPILQASLSRIHLSHTAAALGAKPRTDDLLGATPRWYITEGPQIPGNAENSENAESENCPPHTAAVTWSFSTTLT